MVFPQSRRRSMSASSLRCPGVAMVQAAQVRLRHNFPILGRLDLTRSRRVPVQRKMSSGFVVLGEVFRKNSMQMILIQHDHVVQTLSTYRADYAFAIWILPRSSWGNQHFLDPHVLDPIAEVRAVHAVSIPEQESRDLLKGKRLDDLLGCPWSRRAGREVEVNDSASVMPEHWEHIEHAERDRRDCEEVDRGDLADVVLQERSPILRRRLGLADHVLGHRGLGHDVAQESQLGLNTRGTPSGVLLAHAMNQIADRPIHLRSTRLLPGLPSPVEPKALAMPARQSVRLDDEQG